MKLNYSAGKQDFRAVIPFSKMEKMDDGRLMIEGIATSEALDGDNEIIDYASAKAAFAAWPGNIREQHDPKKAVGRALEVIADDATKQITVRAFISSGAPETQAKCLDGTLSCYSIGGTVDKRVPEKATKADGSEIDVRRVIMESLSETSVVDQGCNPETAFALVKTVGDALVGVGLADEVKVEEIALEVTGTDAEVIEFAKALNESGMTMADAIAAVKAAKPAEKEKADDTTEKGMWNVQDFASCLSCIASIAASAESDMQWEGDASPVPAQLREWLGSGVAIFQAMAAEEAAELLAALTEQAGETPALMMELARHTRGLNVLQKQLADPNLTVTAAAVLAKEYDEPLGEGFADRVIAKAGARHSKEDAGHLQTAHDSLAKLGATCAAKEAAVTPDLVKAAGELAKVAGELADARARLEKLEKQPMPLRTAALSGVRTVSKTQDNPAAATADFTKDQYIYNTDGSVNEAATAMKFVQSLGGQRITAQTFGAQ